MADESQSLIFVFLLLWAACAGIGYIVDRDKGLLWGLGLGPLGLVIAAILKGNQASPSPRELQASNTDAFQKWMILKEVDDDFMSASRRIADFAKENLIPEEELYATVAETYFELNDKQYLDRIVDTALREPRPERDETVEIEAAGGRQVTLTLDAEGQYVAKTLGGTLKRFRSVEQAQSYFN